MEMPIFMDCNKMLQSKAEFSCFVTAEAELTKYYEIIYKLIWSPTFRNMLINFVNYISSFRYIPVSRIPA